MATITVKYDQYGVLVDLDCGTPYINETRFDQPIPLEISYEIAQDTVEIQKEIFARDNNIKPEEIEVVWSDEEIDWEDE